MVPTPVELSLNSLLELRAALSLTAEGKPSIVATRPHIRRGVDEL
jgi:hypothetical protein